MSKIMTAEALVAKCIDIAKNHKTLYVMGCFGAPLTGANVNRYCGNHSYNKAPERTAMIKAVANQNPPVYGFDCVNLIKGILWGWSGDAAKTYGGAKYVTGGVPDINADTMITKCLDVSTTKWTDMLPGEAVWCAGHIGVYIGEGLAAECTPAWKNRVQITAVANIGTRSGYNARRWTKHGRLPWVDYAEATAGGNTGEGPQDTLTAGGPLEAAVGAVVTFTGTKHYTSANAVNGKTCKPGEAKVTAVAKTGKHPYLLIKTAGSASTVYGWVDAADIDVDIIVKGAKVKIKNGAKTYTGGRLASFVYQNTYTAMSVDGERVVIGQNGVVTAAVNIKDLKLVK